MAGRAAVARKLGLTRTLVTKLVHLLALATDLQQAVRGLEAVHGGGPMSERALWPVAHAGSRVEQRLVLGPNRHRLKATVAGYCTQTWPEIPCSPWGLPVEQHEMTETWAAVDEVAKHLGEAKDSNYRRIEIRSLPAHKVGRLWKFKLSQVDEWVRRQDSSLSGNEPTAALDRRLARAPKRRGRS